MRRLLLRRRTIRVCRLHGCGTTLTATGPGGCRQEEHAAAVRRLRMQSELTEMGLCWSLCGRSLPRLRETRQEPQAGVTLQGLFDAVIPYPRDTQLRVMTYSSDVPFL